MTLPHISQIQIGTRVKAGEFSPAFPKEPKASSTSTTKLEAAPASWSPGTCQTGRFQKDTRAALDFSRHPPWTEARLSGTDSANTSSDF